MRDKIKEILRKGFEVIKKRRAAGLMMNANRRKRK